MYRLKIMIDNISDFFLKKKKRVLQTVRRITEKGLQA